MAPEVVADAEDLEVDAGKVEAAKVVAQAGAEDLEQVALVDQAVECVPELCPRGFNNLPIESSVAIHDGPISKRFKLSSVAKWTCLALLLL